LSFKTFPDFDKRQSLAELHLSGPFDPNFGDALLGFNGEAVVYCQGISDTVAHDYAMDYARMIQSRAKGLDAPLPRIPAGLFEPNRNLIRATLERMCLKYFPRVK
jgi:hypothetical protein